VQQTRRKFLSGFIATGLGLLAACAPAATAPPNGPAATQPAPAPTQPRAPAPTQAAAPTLAASAPTLAARPTIAPTTAPQASSAIVDGATKEGEVSWYTSLQPPQLNEDLGKQFTERTGIKVNVTRIGSERLFQRYLQEQSSGVNIADVLHTSDEANFLELKRRNLLTAYRPAGTDAFASADVDPDNTYITYRKSLYAMAYNTRLLKATDAPTTWSDLTDPKWKGKIVHGHPSYSGGVTTGMTALVKLLGWDYFEALGKLDVMIVQASSDTTQTVASGERAVAVGSSEYTVNQRKAAGEPIEVIYPTQGAPLLISPIGIVANAPHPNAAKLLMDFLLSQPAQQQLIDKGGLYAPHPSSQLRANQKPLTELKLLMVNPSDTLDQAGEIRKRFTDIFGGV
jgi:iron(III) transport system substrate-binding protein